ncbi:dopamine receptor 2-like [Palaemon carinicauda]|uniref:dopamine receptor 2-like n=1 Tax=Palaemon carinicauda TaxID=392227 RepID=UPI0035B61555
MIPRITNNRTANWGKHVHSLFSLKVSDFKHEKSRVNLDNSPFILEEYESHSEAGEGWPPPVAGSPGRHESSTTTTTLSPLTRWGNGHFARKELPTHYDEAIDADEGGYLPPSYQVDDDEEGDHSGSSTATTLPDLTGTFALHDDDDDEDNAVGKDFFHRVRGTGGFSTRYGINFAIDTSDRSDSQWWFRTSDTAGPVLIDAHNNATDWVNDTSLNWASDISATVANETIACSNLSHNDSRCTGEGDGPLIITPESLSLCLLLLFFAVSTIFGNGLVIVAVARERYLHTVTNYFIMSLAVADCLVGALVMPFSALYDSFDYWPFGPDFCDVWRSFDVLASTASILNLCVISLDRYWAITDPFTYPSRMSPRRACMLIALVWVCSALISFPAIAWWRAVSEPHPPGNCPFTEDLSYLVFSSTISFYGPLFVMVFTYFRIYRAATEQTKSLKLGQKLVSSMGDGEMELTLRIHRGGVGGSGGASSNGNGMPRAHYPAGKTCSYAPENGGLGDSHALSSPLDDGEGCPLGPMHEGSSPDSSTKMVARNIKNFSISRKLCKFAKEKKAAKTLGIVMGVFIVCWLPFFVTNLLSGLCGEQCIREPALVGGVVTWLGWINSAMNPVIYACWAKDFRR